MLRIFLFPRCTMSLVSNVGRRMRSKLSTRKRAAWWWSSFMRFVMPNSHAVRGLPQIALSAGSGLGRPADELVEVVAEALDTSEVVLADLAGVGFRKPGEEGAYAGVECDDACLGLALAPFGPERLPPGGTGRCAGSTGSPGARRAAARPCGGSRGWCNRRRCLVAALLGM